MHASSSPILNQYIESTPTPSLTINYHNSPRKMKSWYQPPEFNYSVKSHFTYPSPAPIDAAGAAAAEAASASAAMNAAGAGAGAGGHPPYGPRGYYSHGYGHGGLHHWRPRFGLFRRMVWVSPRFCNHPSGKEADQGSSVLESVLLLGTFIVKRTIKRLGLHQCWHGITITPILARLVHHTLGRRANHHHHHHHLRRPQIVS